MKDSNKDAMSGGQGGGNAQGGLGKLLDKVKALFKR